jgi:hypothetical protein
LAVDAVLGVGPDAPLDAARRYERALAGGMSIDHRLAATLSRGLSHRKGVRGALRIAGANDWTRRHFARWLFEDYPRAALATPWRWHRGLFNRPGAFRS